MSDAILASRKLLLVSVALGLASIVLPWWNLVFLWHGQVAYFGSHLWGVMKTGFVTSQFSYEWWCYTTLALVVVACAFGYVGYTFVKKNTKTAKLMVIFEIILTITACVFYVTFLSRTFSTISQFFWLMRLDDQFFIAAPFNFSVSAITWVICMISMHSF